MAHLQANSSAVQRIGQWTLAAVVVILGVASFAIIVTSATVMREEIQAGNAAGLALFSEIHTQHGLSTLVDTVEIATRQPLGVREVFGVFTLEGEFLAGDMPQEPDLASSNEITLIHAAGDTETAYIGRRILLPDAVLYVGRPSKIMDRTIANLTMILPLTFLSILVVFIVFFRLAVGTMGRLLGKIEHALKAFSSGDHTARVQLGPDYDDRFHEISVRINDNLNRVDDATNVLENTTVAIAHDLRTPLTRASLAVQMAENSSSLDEETADKLHQASLEIGALCQTFDTILRISNINATSSDAALTTFELQPLVAEIIESFVAVFEDAGFVLTETATMTAPALIRADKSMVGQMIINLLTNVTRHCPVGTSTQVEISQRNDQIILTVSDNGPGVPPEKLSWIFAPFSRVDESRTKSGTGLGLALAKSIAQHNGATIVARNLNPGLAFDVIFPQSAGRKLG